MRRRNDILQPSIADALLPEMKYEASMITQSIDNDTRRLENEAARFQFSEQKKDAIRRDYEFNQKVELDGMRDEYLGGFLQGLNGVDPNDPEARDKINGIMSTVPPDLYNNRALQGAFTYAAGQAAKREQIREHEIGSMRDAALSEIKRMGKEEGMGRYAYDATGMLVGAKSADEMKEVLNATNEQYSKIKNTRGVKWIQDNALTGELSSSIAAKYGLNLTASPDENITKIAIAMGVDPTDEAYATQAGKATLIPRIMDRVEADKDNIIKYKSAAVKTGVALVNDLQRDARKKIATLTAQIKNKYKDQVEKGGEVDTSYEDAKIKEAKEYLLMSTSGTATDDELRFAYSQILDLGGSTTSTLGNR